MASHLIQPKKIIWIFDPSVSDASGIKSRLKKEEYKFELFFDLKELQSKMTSFKSYDVAPSCIIGDIEITEGLNFVFFIDEILAKKPEWQEKILVVTHVSYERFVEMCQTRQMFLSYVSKNRLDKDLILAVEKILESQKVSLPDGQPAVKGLLTRRLLTRFESLHLKLKTLYYDTPTSEQANREIFELLDGMEPLLASLNQNKLLQSVVRMREGALTGIKLKKELKELIHACDEIIGK